MKELKEDWMHIRLRPTEKVALEKLATMRGTDLSKLARGTLVEICVVAGLLQDPAANSVGQNCAVCGRAAARPVELSNGTTLQLCSDCVPIFDLKEDRPASYPGGRLVMAGEGAR